MNDSKTITYRISKDGQTIEVDAVGFQGQGCLEFAKKAMQSVGEVQDMKKKPAFFEQAHQHVRI